MIEKQKKIVQIHHHKHSANHKINHKTIRNEEGHQNKQGQDNKIMNQSDLS